MFKVNLFLVKYVFYKVWRKLIVLCFYAPFSSTFGCVFTPKNQAKEEDSSSSFALKSNKCKYQSKLTD